MSFIDVNYGRQLPVTFVEGYIDTFWRAEGGGITPLTYTVAAKSLIPDEETREQWLAPLYAYTTPGVAQRRPLDYRLVALFVEGLPRVYGSKGTLAVKPVTRRIGQKWWAPRSPIAPSQDQHSLQILFAGSISAHLDQWKSGAPKRDKKTTDPFEERARMGVDAFFTALNQQSGIPCAVRQEKTHLVIEIIECPFCLRGSPECWIFLGITTGLLEWLHGTHGPNAIPPVLQINEDASTGHTIVLDIMSK